MAKVHVTYQSGYNGCDVDGDVTPTQQQAIIDAVVNEAYKDVIKSGRHEGEFNGDIDELEEFAIKTVKDTVGADVVVTFEEDSMSS